MPPFPVWADMRAHPEAQARYVADTLALVAQETPEGRAITARLQRPAWLTLAAATDAQSAQDAQKNVATPSECDLLNRQIIDGTTPSTPDER